MSSTAYSYDIRIDRKARKIVVDARESNEDIKAMADEITLLQYEESNHTILKVERKAWADLVQSWASKKLERQLLAVDVLIVEDPTEQERKFAKRSRGRMMMWDRAEKHLAKLTLAMPVIRTKSVAGTVAVCRFLCSTPSLEVRESQIVPSAAGPLEAFLRALGVPTGRLSPGYGTVGDALVAQMDKQALVGALRVDSWASVPGIGTKTLKTAQERLSAL